MRKRNQDGFGDTVREETKFYGALEAMVRRWILFKNKGSHQWV